MNKQIIDLTGKRFGRLFVLSLAPSRDSKARWLCQCDCGAQTTVFSRHLRDGATKSCGCLNREIAIKRHLTHGHAIGNHTPTYKSWSQMFQRCHNPNNPGYRLYGAKGVKVCERWHKFENFLADMGERPIDKTIDRFPNKAGDYELGNCRWATKEEQGQNTSQTKLTPKLVQEIRQRIAKGETNRHLARVYGINRATVSKINRRKTWDNV
jgi:hypothetical protein